MGIYIQKNGTRSPVGGGINSVLLTRLQFLESEASGLRQELTQVRQSRGGEDYGLVKLTTSRTVTDSAGLAMPASENNAGMANSLAYRVEKTSEKLDNYVKTVSIQSAEISVPANNAYNGHIVMQAPDGYKALGAFQTGQTHGAWSVYYPHVDQAGTEVTVYFGVYNLTNADLTGTVNFDVLFAKN